MHSMLPPPLVQINLKFFFLQNICICFVCPIVYIVIKKIHLCVAQFFQLLMILDDSLKICCRSFFSISPTVEQAFYTQFLLHLNFTISILYYKFIKHIYLVYHHTFIKNFEKKKNPLKQKQIKNKFYNNKTVKM